MDNYTTSFSFEQLKQLSFKEIIRGEVEKTINQIMETELSSFLGYEKYSKEGYNTGNSRNGFYTRKFATEYGEINLSIPRDRAGLFKSHLVPAYAREADSLEQTVILLYQHGVTTREISDLIEKMYGHHYSCQTISNINKVLQENIKEFHTRPIKNRYVAVYCDSTWMNIRRNSVAKEALHIILGITEDGHKEILDYALYPEERAENYFEMLQDLKERGLSEVLLFITDGLKGFSDALLRAFPTAKHQICWVHLSRNIGNLVRAADRGDVLADFKTIYAQNTAEEAQNATIAFCEKYGKIYPKIKLRMSDWTSLFTFYEFPKAIRRSIYTSNIIENFNKQIKRQIGKKEQFPTEDSMERFICSMMIDYNDKNSDHIHLGFGKASSEILDLFSQN